MVRDDVKIYNDRPDDARSSRGTDRREKRAPCRRQAAGHRADDGDGDGKYVHAHCDKPAGEEETLSRPAARKYAYVHARAHMYTYLRVYRSARIHE